MPSVAIVVPTYRDVLLPDEEISLRHLRKYLSGYDCYWIAPPNVKIHARGERIKRFGQEHFQSQASYSRLLLSEEFYTAFLDYEFILIYQLDSLVFSDELGIWCRQGMDYIGAPLLKSAENPHEGFSRVGNGGLSLRRVKGFLRVIRSKRFTDPQTSPGFLQILAEMPADIRAMPLARRYLKMFRVWREIHIGVRQYMSIYTLNEDLFWSDRARLFDPAFRIAPIEMALRFAFENHPRYYFEQNNRQLPFGCHAWAKWDRVFWRPFLI